MDILTQFVLNDFRWKGNNIIPTVRKYDESDRNAFDLFVEIETNSLHLNHIGSVYKKDNYYVYRFGVKEFDNYPKFLIRIEKELFKFICEVPDLHGRKMTIGFITQYHTSLQAEIEKHASLLGVNGYVSKIEDSQKARVIIENIPATFNPLAIKSWIGGWKTVAYGYYYYFDKSGKSEVQREININNTLRRVFPLQMTGIHFDETRCGFATRSACSFSPFGTILLCKKCMMPKIASVCLCDRRTFYLDDEEYLMLCKDSRFKGLSTFETSYDGSTWTVYNISIPVLILLNFYKVKYEDLAFFYIEDFNETIVYNNSRDDIIKFWKFYEKKRRER